MKELKVAMIGYGGIGAVHKAAYDSLRLDGVPVRLVAICDKNEDSIKQSRVTNLGVIDSGSFDGISFYTDLDELMRTEEFDAADICLPTFLHKEYAVKLISAGKHVLCEKPMALTSDDCYEMVRAANDEGRELLVGQCLRFDPAYLYLKSLVTDGTLGDVRRIVMSRMSFMPRWGGWFVDKKKSGGCIIDFHIHDVDMLRFILGEPISVSAVSYPDGLGWQYVSTRFEYGGVIAEATASFDESPTERFSMGYRARFERASVVFDSGAVTVFPDEGEPYKPQLPVRERITEEIRYFADIILNEKKNGINPPSDAANTIRLCELIAESAASGGAKIYTKAIEKTPQI